MTSRLTKRTNRSRYRQISLKLKSISLRLEEMVYNQSSSCITLKIWDFFDEANIRKQSGIKNEELKIKREKVPRSMMTVYEAISRTNKPRQKTNNQQPKTKNCDCILRLKSDLVLFFKHNFIDAEVVIGIIFFSHDKNDLIGSWK